MPTYDEEFYLNTIKELRDRLAYPTAYNVVCATGLLRKLSLDGGNSLVDLVNRRHRVRLQFKAMRDIELPLANKLLHWRSPNPGGLPEASLQFRNRDAFLAMVCLESGTKSVADIIRFCAFVLGGNHRGKPKNPADDLIAEFDAFMQKGPTVGYITIRSEVPMSIRTAQDIVAIVIEGLEPLTQALQR